MRPKRPGSWSVRMSATYRPRHRLKRIAAAISQCRVIATAPYRRRVLEIAIPSALLVEFRLDSERNLVAHKSAPEHLVEAEIASPKDSGGMKAERIVATTHHRFSAAVERNVENHGPCNVLDRQHAIDPAGVGAGSRDGRRFEGHCRKFLYAENRLQIVIQFLACRVQTRGIDGDRNGTPLRSPVVECQRARNLVEAAVKIRQAKMPDRKQHLRVILIRGVSSRGRECRILRDRLARCRNRGNKSKSDGGENDVAHLPSFFHTPCRRIECPIASQHNIGGANLTPSGRAP